MHKIIQVCPCLQPRKAKESLAASSKASPVYVQESLPFGNDGMETQPLGESELDLLAKSFDAEEPDIPEDPPVVPGIAWSCLKKCPKFFLTTFPQPLGC